jgi:hypothetical protein
MYIAVNTVLRLLMMDSKSVGNTICGVLYQNKVENSASRWLLLEDWFDNTKLILITPVIK